MICRNYSDRCSRGNNRLKVKKNAGGCWPPALECDFTFLSFIKKSRQYYIETRIIQVVGPVENRPALGFFRAG
jgi:hypothetical protein